MAGSSSVSTDVESVRRSNRLDTELMELDQMRRAEAEGSFGLGSLLTFEGVGAGRGRVVNGVVRGWIGGGGDRGGVGMQTFPSTIHALLLSTVLRARLRKQLHRRFFQWKRVWDDGKVEEQLVTARSFMDVAMQAQKFDGEQQDKIEVLSRQSRQREVEIGKRDGTIDKLESEKRALQDEVKLAKSFGVDMKRKASVLGFQVKAFVAMNQRSENSSSSS